MESMSILLESGFDAFTNLYEVSLVLPPAVLTRIGNNGVYYRNLLNDSKMITVRATDFKIPSLNLGTYNVDYQTVTLERPNAMFMGEREFDLTFRVDGYFDIYRIFQEWKKLYMNYETDEVRLGMLSGDVSATFIQQEDDGTVSGGNTNVPGTEYYGSVRVRALQAVQGYPMAKEWGFGQVMCINITEPNFTRESSNALTFTAKFICGQVISPESMIEE